MNRIKLIAALAALPAFATLAGCAAAVDGNEEQIAIQTTLGGWPLAGANCTLTNSKGSWTVTTPANVYVQRSHAALQITCDKPGVPTGTLTVENQIKGLAWVTLVGPDAATQTAFEYPDILEVRMGVDATAKMRQAVLPERYWLHADPPVQP